ncbi:MAG: transglycosylase domain-containing protein, partial [Hyphomicrobiales bacterium]|nr:transglycosylase domain-containing protein [Hyphomicrobiales bacterium]
MREHPIERRIFATIGALLFVLSLALPGAWNAYLERLGPLDLAAARIGSTIVVDREGRLLRAFTLPDGRWRLPLTAGEVDPRYLAMLLAYEDGRFTTHDGVDWRALTRAAAQFATRGHVVSGGSTLTMQVARLIEPRQERSLAAKLRQIVRAWQIERRVGKPGVLERYLALAPFGGNLEGVRAASLAYFGKEPRRLTLGEMALLVALPQSPEARRPDRAPNIARRARERVIERIAAAGIVGRDEIARAQGEPVPNLRRAMPVLAAHAAD